jgi:hypothetical protein
MTSLLRASLVTALAVTTAVAQSDLGFYRPLTLAPADALSSGGGGAGGDDEKAKAAELAKATQNPIASLISVPLQNNFDWGGGPNAISRKCRSSSPRWAGASVHHLMRAKSSPCVTPMFTLT